MVPGKSTASNAGDGVMPAFNVPDDSTSTSSSVGAAAAPMDRRLLEAATTGDATYHLADQVLLGTTPQKNTCLHIAAIHGHQGFCERVLMTCDQYRLHLVKAINANGETPLLTAVTRGRTTLTSALLGFCLDHQLRDTILKRDKCGFNALHHAICSGHRELAVQLIQAEPDLSQAVNNDNESPMYSAVMRNYGDVLEKLLVIPAAAVGGARGYNALHAAVTSGNAVMAKKIMDSRPALARLENDDKRTPMHLAVIENKIDVLTVLLQHDRSLGYLISSDGFPLLCTAATKGNVGVAREFLRHCPDAPYYNKEGWTCLHIAVSHGEADFVRFVQRSPQLQHLMNRPNDRGETALQLAQRIMQEDNGEEKKNKDEEEERGLCFTADVAAVHLQGMEGLVEASVCGDVAEMRLLHQHDPGVLLGITPQGNTCLHIAAIHGREMFCKEVQALNPSLLTAVNSDGETPLLAAVASSHVSIASVLLRYCRDQQLSEAILKQDKHGCNVLHHAIRSGHRELAQELIEAEPALSHAVNQYGESPMFIVVMRNYKDVFDVFVKLVEIPDSAHGGAYGMNALHAAVRNGNSAIAKKIVETRPALAQEQNGEGDTPMRLAVRWDKTVVLRVLLEHDRSLGYEVSSSGTPLIATAAFRGHVSVARELLKHCPDAPLTTTDGFTCLHQAVSEGHMEFVDFFLGLPISGRLLNMRNQKGNTALHLAVQTCNPKMVAALLLHPDIDVTVYNKRGDPAIWQLNCGDNRSKTLNWNEISMLMLKADPQAATDIYNLRRRAHHNVTKLSREDIRSLTQTYTGNTSLVAILIATITFAAAFTLPGGYSTDAGNEGIPIMARKFAFKAFLVCDTLAMCSSLVVAFVCIIARWEDLELLLHYRSFTKKLMWFAYMATTIAFATGLYTVLAPRLLWLAVAVCVLTSLLPILTKLLGEWPILRLRFRLGPTYKSELLDMV